MKQIARKPFLIRGYNTRKPSVAAIASGVDCLVRALHRPRLRSMPSPVRRILVSKIDHLGDLLLLARVMPAIRSLYPDARIDLLTGSWSRQLAECIPGVSEIITYDSMFLNRVRSFPRSIVIDITSFFSAVTAIRRGKYDLGIDMRAGMVNGIPAMSFGNVNYIVGYATGGFGRMLDLTVNWKPVNEIEKFCEVVRALGLQQCTLGNLELNIPGKSRSRAAELVNKRKVVFLQPGCGRSAGWPVENWSKLAKFLCNAGWNIFITGNAKEYKLGEQISAGIPDAVNLCGAMDVKTFLAAIRKADLFVGLDSFPSHASIACGVPTILIFNPDTSEEFFPLGNYLLFPFDASAREIIGAVSEQLQDPASRLLRTTSDKGHEKPNQ